MKIHVCLYLNGDEVINLNDVQQLNFLYDCLCINTHFNSFWYRYNEFDKIEVDYYD